MKSPPVPLILEGVEIKAKASQLCLALILFMFFNILFFIFHWLIFLNSKDLIKPFSKDSIAF